MIKIAICDDEPIFLDHIYTLVCTTLNKYEITYTIDNYLTGNDFCQALTDGILYHIVFLDICMDGIDGVNVGSRLRLLFNNSKTILIYISAYDNRAKEVFYNNTHRFISKPVDESLFEEALISAYEIIKERQSKTFTFKVAEKGWITVSLEDIIYFEVARSHRINVVTANNSYTIYEKIKNLCQKLSLSDFITIHYSYLINYKHIRNISYEQVEMDNDIILPISGPKRKEVRRRYTEIRKQKETFSWL